MATENTLIRRRFDISARLGLLGVAALLLAVRPASGQG
jgi:hypothetical protein